MRLLHEFAKLLHEIVKLLHEIHGIAGITRATWKPRAVAMGTSPSGPGSGTSHTNSVRSTRCTKLPASLVRPGSRGLLRGGRHAQAQTHTQECRREHRPLAGGRVSHPGKDTGIQNTNDNDTIMFYIQSLIITCVRSARRRGVRP